MAKKQKPKPWKEVQASHRKSWKLPFIGIEWCCEWISYWFGRWAFLEVLEYFGKLGILVAIIAFFYPGCRDRRQAAESAKQAAADARKTRHYVAWQTINSAMGKPGNAGRANALQDLAQDGVSMKGISLSGHTILIGPLNLSDAKMEFADLSDAEFENVNFSRAEFMQSKWDNTRSFKCNFTGTSFWAVKFNNTTFSLCDFGVADAERPSVFFSEFRYGQQSRFEQCNFAGAEMGMNIWESVSFSWCNFANANLRHAFLGTNATVDLCNLFNAKTDSTEFIKMAFRQRVAFTNVTSLEGWRHCLTNGVDFKAGSPEFIQWASNQYTTYIVTNNPAAWLDWSRENLKSN